MKKNIYFLLLLILTYACSTIDSEPDYTSEVDSVFSQWDDSAPGGAIGVIRNGQLEFAKGYGLANLEYDIPNTPQSVFRIASVSKQFTAACIVLLAEEGKLSLEDTLSKFYPQLPDYADDITIRHLLNHTSGLRDYLELAYLSGLTDDDFYTDDELMGWFVRQKGYNFSAGEEFLYCNTGYWLLGQIVEQMSGMNMAEYARKNIFEPLGMDHTHFHNDNTKIVENRASGYAPTADGFRISMTQLEMIGDGAIFTTVEDMAKWDENFYSHKIGSPDFHQTLQTQAVLNNGDTLPYAMGLSVGEYKGHKTVEHGGAFVGFRARFLRFPEERLSIVLLTNRSDANYASLSNEVADILLDLEDISEEVENEENEGIGESEDPTEPASYTTQQLARLTGTYHSEELGVDYELKLNGTRLILWVDGDEISALKPMAGRKFENEDFGLLEFEDRMPRPNSFLLTSGRVKNLYFEREE